MKTLLTLTSYCALLAASVCAEEETRHSADVVVYGGTSAGVIAAVQAKAMGKTVLLVSPEEHLGGLTSGGLGWTDSGNKTVIGGLSRDFYRRVKKHYDDPKSWRHEDRAKYSRYRAGDDAMWTFEPHVAERIFDDLVRESRIPILRRQLDREQGVVREGIRITAIRTTRGETIRGKVFLDCTYEGDLMAAAGVTYAVGREPNATYGETLNGVGTRWNTHLHRFVRRVDPYVVPGKPDSGLLPGIDPKGPGREGEGDHRLQAYNYRLCITDAKRNQVPFAKPDGYDERQYELLFRNFEAGDLRLPLKIDMMPNRKTDVNNNCAVSTDFIGMNYEYPDASAEKRAEILAKHETYIRGLMWALANHARVPERIRRRMSGWGWARDEFTDNGHFPHQIYVREARRMVGHYVMTELDCRMTRDTPGSIGMGSYNMDSHNVQRYVTKDGYVQNEGDVQVSPGGPYEIAYGAICPKREECTNLLVPVAVSSSHAAYGSIRMEPVFMILGQSAATAAVLAFERDEAVQDLPYAVLKQRLLADGQVLEYDGPRRTGVAHLTGLKGLVLDDTTAKREGTWTPSASVGPILGASYLHDGNDAKGDSSLVFTPEIEKGGRYEVRLLYTANPNRATNVPVTIESADGAKTVRVDQKRKPGGKLGVFRFESGRSATITVSNTGTNGYVVVDGVQLIRAQ